MKRSWLATVVVCGFASVAFAAGGCEYIVRLDRGLVDAGEAGCPICSDVGAQGDDSGTEPSPTDATLDGASD
jgi:hypothetical protein